MTFEAIRMEDVTKSQSECEENEEQKETWTSSTHFLMSCIAMSVGLGNVWRFPFTAYENGGGVFLIPYVIVLALAGRPVYYLEACLGQFSGKSNVAMFNVLAPALKGLGYGQVFVTLCVSTYYSSVMAISLHYFLNSFSLSLPWANCNVEWEEENTFCVSAGSSTNNSLINGSYISSSELWFTKEVLSEKSSIDDGIGWPNLKLTFLLFLSWFLLFVVTAKGIKSSGKASYFFALFPYVIMCTLLIRAVTLEGSSTGILYFLTPQWHKLAEAKVWYNVLTQCFYSLNIGGGTIIMLSSYNKFDHNLHRDTLIITALDTLASMLCGIVTFGILGNLAHELNVNITHVVTSGGTRLAFITYPDAIAKFTTTPWLFSILFFTMLFVLGLGSLVCLQGTIFAVIKDVFPSLKHYQVSLISTTGGFLISLVYVTPGGQFILTLVDNFGVTFVFFVLILIEVIAILWFYGVGNIMLDVEFMLQRKLSFYWKLCWGFVTPFSLLAIFIYFLLCLEAPKYGNREFPKFFLTIGWMLAVVGISQPLLWWIIHLYKNRKSDLIKVILKSFSFKNWRPHNEDVYEEWKIFTNKINT